MVLAKTARNNDKFKKNSLKSKWNWACSKYRKLTIIDTRFSMAHG